MINVIIALIPSSIYALNWTGNVNSNWNNAANWQGGVLPAAQNITIDPANFTGAKASPIISVNSTFIPAKIDVFAGGNLTIQANLTTTDRVRVDGNTSVVNMSAGTLNITTAKDLQVQNDAVFNMTGGTINISGKLTVDIGGTFNMSGAGSIINVTDILEVLDKQILSSSFNMTAGTVNVTAGVELDAAGTVGATPTLSVSGGAFNGNSYLWWIDNGAPAEYPRLIVSGGVVTFTGNVQRDASTNSKITIAISGGTLALNGNLTMNTALDRLDQTGGILQFSNAKNWTNSGTYLATAGTAIFNGSTTLLSATGAWQFYHLTINATKTLNQSAPPNINVGGNWLNNGTFVPNAKTVTFNGSVAQNVGGVTPTVFNNLTLNNTFATIPQLIFNVGITTNNVLTMTSGVVNLNGNLFTLGVSATASTLTRAASTTTNWFYGGTFKRFWVNATTITSASGNFYGLFPMGTVNASSYRPVQLNSTGNITTSGFFTVNHVDASTVTDLSPVYNDAGTNITRIQNAQFITAISGVTVGTFNISVTMTGLLPGTLSDIRLAIFTGGTTASAVGTHAASTGTATNPTATRTGISTLSNLNNDFRISTINKVITPLPIELLEFTGACLTEGVQLNWSTASEINNDYFLIEKSRDGYQWEQVAKVRGLANSSIITKYVHIDYTSQNGLVYYRLSQVDINGTKKIFKAIDVYCNDNNIKDQMILYPNPSSTELNIILNVNKSSNNTSINLVDNTGRLVFESGIDLIKGVNSFTFPINTPPGSYTILFSSDNIVIPSQKLMIIKP